MLSAPRKKPKFSISSISATGDKNDSEISFDIGFNPHAEDADYVLKKLNVNPQKGLSTEEVLKRQKEYGKNIFQEEIKFNAFLIFLGQFKNPLALLLLVSGILTLFLKEYHNAIIIFGAVLINAGIGFFQENQVSKAFYKLKSSLKQFAVVLREGEKQTIESKEIALGDIVVLKEGDMVPADARIIKQKNLSLNEAALTGEWMPSEKTSEKIDIKSHISERKNMGFMGTLVSRGFAEAVVTAIGEKTEFGKIALSLKTDFKKLTPFQKNIRKISRFIGGLALAAVLILFLLGIFQGRDKTEMFLSAVAVAVAAVPEGLPIAITVILVIGMRNLITKGGLPKNLAALEILGSADSILTDKTGTLTYGDMKVSHITTSFDIFNETRALKLESGESVEAESGKQKKPLSPLKLKQEEEKKESLRLKALGIAQFLSEAFVEKTGGELENERVTGDPIEKAILEAGIVSGINKEELYKCFPRLDFLPFDSERRFTASINKMGGENTLFLSGAPEIILALSSSYCRKLGFRQSETEFPTIDNFLSGGVKMLNPKRLEILKYYEKEAGKGLRIIALASKNTEETEFPKKEDEILKLAGGLNFIGFISFHDPVREDARESLKIAKDAGIEIKIATGDNVNTAYAVAEKVGLFKEYGLSGEKILTGDDIEKMEKGELQEQIKSVSILSRVLPHQKLKIVEALQANGSIVAMTGDGINDAPALSRADIGIALGSGTDTAKESSDLVLTNNNLKIIVYAIKEGRVIIQNIRKVITYLLATGFSEIILIGGSIIAGLPLPVLPAQILWANIIQEGFMNFAYAFEKEEGDVMRGNGNYNKGKNVLFTREMKILIFVIGIITDIFLLILFLALLKLDYDLGKIRTIMFAGLSMDAVFFALSLKSLKNPIWKINIFGNIYLIAAWILSLLFLILALVFSPLQNLLELTPISTNEFLIIGALGILNLISIETAKFWINRKSNKLHLTSNI